MRIAAALPLWIAIQEGRLQLVLALLGFAAVTDLVDGPLARRLGAVTGWGAYLDVTADFLVLMIAFAGFVHLDIYPAWLLVLLAAMFAQFLLTSRFRGA